MPSHAAVSPAEGISGGYTGDSLGLKITMAILIAIAWYNALEMLVLLFVTFRQFQGLYFWCLLVSTAVGVIPYQLGFLLKFFQLTSATWFSVTLITIGWYAMVTGQSMVLFSRLHLVVQNPKILRRVLYMILIDAVLLHVPTTVLTYGSNFDASNERMLNGYNIMERVQMTGFCLQEIILSGIYIYEAVGLLRANPEPGSRRIMYQLLIINFLIVLMDIGVLVTEYLNLYIIQTTLKGTVYSIKLKLEFAVLGKLVGVVRNHGWKPESPNRNNGNYFGEPPEFVDASRLTSDITRATPTNGLRRHASMDPYDVLVALFEHSNWHPGQEVVRPSVSTGSRDTHTSRLGSAFKVEATDITEMRQRMNPNDIADLRPG
jgi:hypothetical protein